MNVLLRRPAARCGRQQQQPSHLRWAAVIRDSAIVVLLSAGLALAFNAGRSSGGIDLIARVPYEVLVPCPEHQGSAEALPAAKVTSAERGVVLVDARSAEEFARWHLPGAISIPFDYLEPVSKEMVRSVLELRPRQVIVYGDGDNPDSGEQLALQISGTGVKNLFFVSGGAPALRELAAPPAGGGR